MKTYEPEDKTLVKALEALRNTTGIDAEVAAAQVVLNNGQRADAKVILKPEGQPHHFFIAEIKRVDRFAHLADIKYHLGEYADEMLLVAPRITEEMADKCKELDLQFIDTTGNAYLKRPGLFVFIKGQRPNETFKLDRPEGKRAVTPTNLRVVFALLCKPALLNATYRDIKDAAEVALGTIGWVFFDLDERGYTVGDKNKRVLLERPKLIQEWVTNYPIKLRPKLNARKFKAPNPEWRKTLDAKQYEAQWGGEAAAEKLTGYLRPLTFTLYFHGKDKQKNITKMIVEHRLKADMFGDIEIIDAFWDFKDEPLAETVPPILVYADLLATLDPRNFETARIIYEKHIANPNT
jgi:hypothetical protein